MMAAVEVSWSLLGAANIILSDESADRGPVCVNMISIARSIGYIPDG